MAKPRQRKSVPEMYQSKQQPGEFYERIQNTYPLSELRYMELTIPMKKGVDGLTLNQESLRYIQAVGWSKSNVKFGLTKPIQLRFVDKRNQHSYGRIAMILDIAYDSDNWESTLKCCIPPTRIKDAVAVYDLFRDPSGIILNWRGCYNADGELTAIIIEIDGDKERNIFRKESKEVMITNAT